MNLLSDFYCYADILLFLITKKMKKYTGFVYFVSQSSALCMKLQRLCRDCKYKKTR